MGLALILSAMYVKNLELPCLERIDHCYGEAKVFKPIFSIDKSLALTCSRTSPLLYCIHESWKCSDIQKQAFNDMIEIACKTDDTTKYRNTNAHECMEKYKQDFEFCTYVNKVHYTCNSYRKAMKCAEKFFRDRSTECGYDPSLAKQFYRPVIIYTGNYNESFCQSLHDKEKMLTHTCMNKFNEKFDSCIKIDNISNKCNAYHSAIPCAMRLFDNLSSQCTIGSFVAMNYYRPHLSVILNVNSDHCLPFNYRSSVCFWSKVGLKRTLGGKLQPQAKSLLDCILLYENQMRDSFNNGLDWDNRYDLGNQCWFSSNEKLKHHLYVDHFVCQPVE